MLCLKSIVNMQASKLDVLLQLTRSGFATTIGISPATAHAARASLISGKLAALVVPSGWLMPSVPWATMNSASEGSDTTCEHRGPNGPSGRHYTDA